MDLPLENRRIKMAGVLSPNAKIIKAGSNFGTPVLAFAKITATASNGSTAVDFSSEASNSDFYKAVNAFQGYAEIYFVDGGTEGIVVAYNANTANSGNGNTSDGSWTDAEAAIKAALAKGGSATATVAALAVASDGLSIA